MPPDAPFLKSELGQVYRTSMKAIRSKNPAWWVECCSAVIKSQDLGSFGHPKDMTIRMKDYLTLHDITSQETFISHMMTSLPKQDSGLILCPQVNIKHPDHNRAREEDVAITEDTQTHDNHDLDPLKDKPDQQSEEISTLKKLLADQAVMIEALTVQVQVQGHSSRKASPRTNNSKPWS